MAVFLAIGGFMVNFLYSPKTGVVEERGILGGPSPLVLSAQADVTTALRVEESPLLISDSAIPGSAAPVFLDEDALLNSGAIRDPGESAGPAAGRAGLISYTVHTGDNLSKIASYFGVSVDTIVSANPGVRANLLRIGDTLKILPVSGVVYEAKPGDTLASISDLFGIPQTKIAQFNASVKFASLDPGTSIVIPGGKSVHLLSDGSSLPNFSSQFIMPAGGYNWGILHHYNAVDIANSCGTPVVASAEGLVVPDENTSDVIDGWNGGYGNFVLIEHPFGDGVRTRYAHLSKILVQVGDYVKQGQEIGVMGQTGEATGCHLHFEVYGAKNPFAKG